jgi:hypothetical protein
MHWASDPSASPSSADIDRATDLVELDFLRKQVAEHEEEMQRCRVAHLMELDFLRQQVAEKGEEMQRCADDLAELDFLRKQVAEHEEEMQRCRVAHLMELDFLRQQVAEKGEEMQRCAADLAELDFLRKQVAEHEEEMQRCRVAHLMELDFLRQQVAEKGEEVQRCAADLAELDFLRKQVTEKEEEIQRCRAEVQRLVKTDKVQLPEHLSQQPAGLATEQEDPFSLVNFDGEVLADAECVRRTGAVNRLQRSAPTATDGSGSGDASSANASNSCLESPQATLCAVKQRQHVLRSARNEPPMKQTSQVSELGVVGRGLSHCQAMWALAQEERVRPLMLVNGLVGVFALIWVMFFMSWGGQRRFVAGIQ